MILPENIKYTIALAVALYIGILGILDLIFGGITDAFDGILPEKDLSVDIESITIANFLYLGKIPLLVWLIVYLVSFGLNGLFLPYIIDFNESSNTILALVLSILPARYVSMIIYKIMPQDETSISYNADFIGLTAKLILSDAKKDKIVQAKLVDKHGLAHYIMVKPEIDEVIKAGSDVIITAVNENSTFNCASIKEY